MILIVVLCILIIIIYNNFNIYIFLLYLHENVGKKNRQTELLLAIVLPDTAEHNPGNTMTSTY